MNRPSGIDEIAPNRVEGLCTATVRPHGQPEEPAGRGTVRGDRGWAERGWATCRLRTE